MSIRVIPDHCNDCTWFFSKMGACPHPDVSMLFSYLSFIPYFIIFYLIANTLIQRKISLIRLTSMLVFAYILGDKLLKNIFQGQRPPFSCKNTYGMPSSHMTVIVAVTFYILTSKRFDLLTKISMIFASILQGIARVQLHYHTYQQVFGGVVFGTLFAYLYFKVFDLVWPKIKNMVPKWLRIQDNLSIINTETQKSS